MIKEIGQDISQVTSSPQFSNIASVLKDSGQEPVSEFISAISSS